MSAGNSKVFKDYNEFIRALRKECSEDIIKGYQKEIEIKDKEISKLKKIIKRGERLMVELVSDK